MVALTTLIVDDEKPAREELAYLLKSIPDVTVVGQARNGLEAVNFIREKSPDVVFLDVQMPGLDGFGVLKKLVDKKVKLPHIVFATAYDHYAVQAFEVHAVDYVLKPFDKARVSESIHRARRLTAAQPAGGQLETLLDQMRVRPTPPAKLLLKTQQRMLLIDAHDMVYATITEGLITIVTRDLDGMSNYRTLEELQAHLDPNCFWRVHRSYLVNINRIKEVIPWFKSTYQLRMDDRRQSEVPVSRAQTRRLREFLKL
ncbi:LytTR family DNA-binding domain-containing protein [Acidobacteriia bacterium AH_259_A11_L15]|nr:LytTR family DNA-binding domain-containing protein [Acidobacteriia bacterium AH_259_A11_L15]